MIMKEVFATVIVISLLLFIIVCIVACCKIAGECSRQEEKEHPCGGCVRWSECNGVDDDCPWRN